LRAHPDQSLGASLFSSVPVADRWRPVLLALLARRHQRVILRRADAKIGQWRPRPHYCFENVDYWVRCSPQCKRVDGFVYFDYRRWGLGFVRFVPHAVVEVEDGTLVDITPHGASDDYPFIRHVGTEEEFVALQAEQGGHVGLDLVTP
jgi:hypothetical protein